MLFTAEQIQQTIRASRVQPSLFPLEATELLVDSRRITFPETSLFFALKGARHDGHQFIEACYQKGVRQFVISDHVNPTLYPEANFFLVDNTVQALQDLAKAHRAAFQIPVIGITGSNGKTIVKEWLFQLLYPEFHIARSPRSYNSQTGVPLSVAQLETHHTLGIFEAGISTTGEMEKLAPLIDCNLGVFTNIGSAHQEGFSSLLEKTREKSVLFSHADTVIYCADYPEIDQCLKALKGPACFSWSRSKKADLTILNTRNTGRNSTEIRAHFQGKTTSITIPFTDEASIENAIHCWCILLYLEYSPEIIDGRMQVLQGVGMRLEQKRGVNNCTIINDSYNADLNSLGIALDFLQQQTHQQQKILILSDLLQTGLSHEALYAKVGKLLLTKNFTQLIGIGPTIPTIAHYLPPHFACTFFPNTASFLQALSPLDFKDSAILIKGARIFELETIARMLTLQSHQTILEINLDALAHNLRVFKKMLLPETKIMAMVKAAAYGSGIIEVARLLAFHRIDFLGVAYPDEGIRIREAGIQTPVLVLNPEPGNWEIFHKFNLEPEIFSLELLEYWSREARAHKKLTPIQIMLDTGMHRLGIMEEDIPKLLDILSKATFCRVSGVFTHLASSANPSDDDFTREQISRFQRMYSRISQCLGYQPLRHVLNSSGIIRFPEFQMEMVRLGLGLYGKDTTSSRNPGLATVMELKARISQIRHLEAGETVGYNRRGKLEKPAIIGTITAGYADGIPRLAGNGNFSVRVEGQSAPLIGDVCMDMCMINLTEVRGAKVGSEVTIFGKQPDVGELARAAQTIPYEIFTNISERVKRVYSQE